MIMRGDKVAKVHVVEDRIAGNELVKADPAI